LAVGGRVQAAGWSLFSYFVRHPTAANLLMVLMMLAGLGAATQIRSQFYPDVVVETVEVSVAWPGAGPEDVDAGVVAVLDPALRAVDGVESATATAREGRASIRLSFAPGWDMGRATEEVRAAVEGVRNLPEGAEAPDIRRGGWRDRVTDVVIHGPVTVEQLGRFADEFAARLYREGITRTTIQGVADPVIRVEVPEASLVRHGITLGEVAAAVAAGTEARPAGEIESADARLRAGTGQRGAEEIGALVLRTEPGGGRLLIRDVAEVREEGAGAGRAYLVRGNPAVQLRVDRNDAGDAIGMQATVARAAAEMQATLPADVTIELIRTRAEGITDRLDILWRNGVMGLALVVGLLFLFLNARTAFWVAAGIPVALTAAVAFMYAAGLTLNMISLFALILTLGMVVDDAIVVAEHADWRHRHLGEPPVEAVEGAAHRMAAPVFSAMITTVLAFFGLMFIGGRFGAMIGDIPFTVIVVLTASLIECFLILPHHMAGALARSAGARWYDAPSRAVNRALGWFRERAFRPLMKAVVALRYPVLAGSVLLLVQAGGLFLKGDVSWRFFAAPEQGSITGNVAMLPGATRADTEAMVAEMERAVAAVAARFAAEHGRDPVAHTVAQVGGTSGRGLAGAETKAPDQLGAIEIELIDPDLRPYSQDAFVAAVQDEVVRHPRLETLSFRGWGQGPGGDSLEVRFTGADARVLKAASEALQTELALFPGVSGLEDSLAYDKAELVLELTPLGAALGFTIEGVGQALYDRLAGIEAAKFPEGTRTAVVKVGLPERESTADFIERTRLPTAEGHLVPLSEIVTVEARPGFSTVRREDGLQVVTVSGTVSEDDPAAAAALMAELEGAILAAISARLGVDYVLAGLAQQERDFLSDALVGFALCLAGIYLTLAWIFGSWLRPLVVMSIIPFGLVGTLWGHYRWGLPLSMFSVVGLIGMTGIIINNSIVLITTIDAHAARRGLVPAVIEGACDRLRPILLTSLTTVLGLAPLLFEASRQALFLKPTVITLVYGLGMGAILVLLVVPALVVVQRDIGRAVAAWRRSAAGGRMPAGPARLMRGASLAALALLAVTVGPWAVARQLVGPAAWIAGATGLSGGAAALAALALGLAVLSAAVLSAGRLRLR
jgi:multidrug efflux pump subunit AcrB